MTAQDTQNLGFDESMVGTRMLRRAVEIVAAAKSSARPQMMNVYADVGNEFSATLVQAERNMRRACRKAGYTEPLSKLISRWALKEMEVQSMAKTDHLVETLRGFAEGTKHVGNVAGADLVTQAADQIEVLLTRVAELEIALENTRRNLGDAREDQRSMEMDRDHLLKIAQKMHLWIFHHIADEYAVYEECGLTDEDDARLGYGGQFQITVPATEEEE